MEVKRKCAACGELKDRSEMIKITKEHKSGNVFVNPNSLTFGRSVYLCYNQECIIKALKSANKGINKALKTKLTNDELKGLLDGQFKS